MNNKRQMDGTQRPTKKRKLDDNSRVNDTQSALTIFDSTNGISRAGKILRIELKNFMCHSNMVVDFNERINLLVGNNGSGKSAILTALVIGLGCKATTTSRSSSITQLIKHGETNGSIEIHLANVGIDAFEPEKYGRKIIINRKIAQSGSSSYHLKNEDGKEISKSKNDLIKMMLYLNIQVDNPVCVLNQDASRTFLKDSDPKKNFQLFLKASQIEKILEELNHCTKSFKESKLRLDYSRKEEQSLCKLVADTKMTYIKLQSVEEMKIELKKLKCVQSWLFVVTQEKLCGTIQKTLTEHRNKIIQLTQNDQQRSSIEQETREKIAEFETENLNCSNQLNEYRARSNDCREAYQRANEQVDTFKMAFRKRMEKKKKLQNEINQLEQEIANESQNQRNKEKKENQARLIELKKQLEDIQPMADNAKRDIQLMMNTKLQLEEDFHKKREQRKFISNKAETISRQIANCDTSSKDTLLVYGDYMSRLVADIERLFKNGKFSKHPRGPIGHYVQVQNDKWKGLIELVIGSTMTAFCVNNAKDRTVLTQLIRDKYPAASKTPIYTSEFHDRMYNVQSGMVQEMANTYLVINQLVVSDAIVMNCLIDNCKIETILMTEDQDLASHLTSHEEHVPQNLLKVLLLNPCSEFYPAPNYRVYSVTSARARYLQVNMLQRKMQLEEQVYELKTQQSQLEKELTTQQTKLKEISHTLNEKRGILMKFEDDLSEYQRNINALQDIEYPADNEREILIEERNELKRLLDEIDGSGTNTDAQLKQLQANLKIKETEAKELKQTIRDIENKKILIDTKLNELKMKLSEISSNSRYQETQLNQIQSEIELLNEQLNEANRKLARLQGTAQKCGDRLTSDLTENEIMQNIKELDRKITATISRSGSIETTKQLLESRTKEYETKKREAETLEKTLKLINRTVRERFNLVIKLKHHMSCRVQHTFTSIMKLRNYNGQIKFDHDAQELHLSVIPRDRHIESAVSNAKCLSGGERSYSTVAFLLSLWSCVNHPFYFLDEYDVYTDQVNRYYMTQLLLSEAKKKPDRQYTFLTPQDMSQIEATDAIRILKLSDPER